MNVKSGSASLEARPSTRRSSFVRSANAQLLPRLRPPRQLQDRRSHLGTHFLPCLILRTIESWEDVVVFWLNAEDSKLKLAPPHLTGSPSRQAGAVRDRMDGDRRDGTRKEIT